MLWPITTGRSMPSWAHCHASRNVVERCINRLKQWRGLATRYEKRVVNYRALVVIASIALWLSPGCLSQTIDRT
jgi:transposase